MDELLADFLTEVSEGLAELDNALVTLERTPGDAATLSLIFRQVHTIKGTCGFLGLSRLERVAHAAEDVLGRVRDGELVATPEIVDRVLAAIDCIKGIVAGITESGGTEPEGADAALIAELRAIADGDAAPSAISATDMADAIFAAPAASQGPASQTPGPRRRKRAVRPRVAPPEPAAAAPASVGIPVELPVEMPAIAAAPVAAARKAPEPKAGPEKGGEAVLAQTIRVGVETLEGLMTLVGELVLTRNQLLQLSRTQADSALVMPLQRLSRLTSELQDSVMKTRMQPIGNAWNKLPRLIRDLGVELGKQIDLEMHGAETELDRQVLEQIRDPLTHVVRNAADHGLETTAERRAAGKPDAGRVTLRAFHEGGHVVIEISDDGKGLNTDRIRAKALSSGLATEAELAAMSESQIQRFIFMAGFSTAAKITSVSGRGVGMDVVRNNIERINGTIDISSVAGEGTVLSIRIPLTLAIVSGLIVKSARERFVIPQLNVVELVRASGGGEPGAVCVNRIGGTKMLRLRDQLLPLVELAPVLGLADPKTDDTSGVIVVVQAAGGMFGIGVDDVFDTEEIVVKPVAQQLRHLTLFSGNTILGDGAVIMILDPGGLARTVGLDASRKIADAQTPATAARLANKVKMLLFRAGDGVNAVPLDAVARLELIRRSEIEGGFGARVVQYRGQLMPLVALSESTGDEQSVLVFHQNGRSIGLMVEEIVDIIEDEIVVELSAAVPGTVGTAVLAGRATDVIDQTYWLSQASPVWAGTLAGGAFAPSAANTDAFAWGDVA